jgi:hypothetical protein
VAVEERKSADIARSDRDSGTGDIVPSDRDSGTRDIVPSDFAEDMDWTATARVGMAAGTTLVTAEPTYSPAPA